MCGINLIIDKKGIQPNEAIARLTQANHHRGPDATTYHTEPFGKGHIYFGHNRLKIIDPSEAAGQPFFSPDKRYLLIYNGEVYNYRALRTHLQAQGHQFRTQSDTEVVLTILITYGQAGLEKLNGMFALVFYDTHTQQILAARDRFGIKRLYYFNSDDYLIISSEITGIHASGLVKKELNESQLEPYLLYRHALKPQTFFRHILELEERQALTYNNQELRLQTYLTTAQYTPAGLNDAEIVAHTQKLLLESVENHLLADVPVGIFLSGGVDSTLILALLHKLGHRQFPAFTIGLSAAEGSFGSEDYRFSRIAAQQFGADHQTFEIDATILQRLDEFISVLDQPIADNAALLTYYLSEQVRPRIKVALSGAGADELFAGYNRHRAFYHFLQNRRRAGVLMSLFKHTAPLLPTGMAHPLRKQFVLLRKLAKKIEPHKPAQTFLNFTTLDHQVQSALLPQWRHGAAHRSISPLKDLLRWGLEEDLHQYLISDVLAMTDKTSMAHSLEVRTPYLENNLQAFLKQLPTATLFKNGSKWILKRILDPYQPDQELTNRPKEGFGLPLGNWLKQAPHQWLLRDLTNPEHQIFNYIAFAPTQQLIQSHLKSRHDYSAEIWALVVLARWLDQHFS